MILNRIKELKEELEIGNNHLKMLESKQTSLQGDLLRISGAIQVLQELLEQENIERKPQNSTSDVPEEELPATVSD